MDKADALTYAREYRRIAALHKNQAFSMYLSEAAGVIERLCEVPRFDLEAQVKKLGADSLLPDWQPRKVLKKR